MASFRPKLWATVFTVPALILLIGLGTWQVQRLNWKTELLETRDAALALPPITLSKDTSPEAIGYRRGQATGTFLHDHELYLGPRVYNALSGLHVLTPMRLADGGVLLVNRGWVPTDGRDPRRRPDGQLAGEQTVRGIVLAPSAPGWFTPENDPAGNYWFWLDLDAMAAQVGEPLLPFVLATDETAVPGGLPIGGQGHVEVRNEHLQYAITWYGLAVVLIVIYVLFHRTPRKGTE